MLLCFLVLNVVLKDLKQFTFKVIVHEMCVKVKSSCLT
jgi:hypothetical protein